jgi:hypothetical protein
MSRKDNQSPENRVIIILTNTKNDLDIWYNEIGSSYSTAKLAARYARRQNYLRGLGSKMRSHYEPEVEYSYSPVQSTCIATTYATLDWQLIAEHVLAMWESRTNQHELL